MKRHMGLRDYGVPLGALPEASALFCLSVALLLYVVATWAIKASAFGGIGAELLNYLPIAGSFGLAIVVLCLTWLWLKD